MSIEELKILTNMLDTLSKHHLVKDLSSSLSDEAIYPVSQIASSSGRDSERTIRPSLVVWHVVKDLTLVLVR